MVTTTKPKYGGLIFDFFGVLTFNMAEVISYFEDRERLARGTFLRAWADPRGQALLMGRYLHDAFPAHQVLKVARQARAAGIKTAVLSNSLGREPYDPYAGFDLHHTFDEVVLSSEHGVRKPDPAIFRLVLSKLGVAAEQCLFVDDSEENLAAAHRLGITPLLALDEKVVAVRLREMLGLSDL